MILRLAIFVLLVYVLVKVIRKVVPTAQRGAPRTGSTELVQDPVCGVYIPRARALSVIRGGITYYFCSPQCRSRFLSDEKCADG